jgi:hypothetical protein
MQYSTVVIEESLFETMTGSGSITWIVLGDYLFKKTTFKDILSAGHDYSTGNVPIGIGLQFGMGPAKMVECTFINKYPTSTYLLNFLGEVIFENCLFAECAGALGISLIDGGQMTSTGTTWKSAKPLFEAVVVVEGAGSLMTLIDSTVEMAA